MNQTDITRQLVKAMPDAPARTLARRLRDEYPQVYSSVDNARKSVMYVLGTNGGYSRKRAGTKSGLFREPRAAGQKQPFPPSSAEAWIPYYLPAPCVVLSLSDFHVPYHDQAAIEKAVRTAKRRHKITDLVLNGDYADFYQISRFEKSPLKRSLKDELTIQRSGLEWLAVEFKKQRRVYKLGNHDVRWDKYVWQNAPILADCDHMQLHEILQFAKYGFTRVDDQPVMAGKLPIFHGHELGVGPMSVSPARSAFMKTMHSVLVAHHHRTSSHAETDLWHKERMAWSQGCLCDMNPEYARVNKFNRGFAVIEVASDRSYNVINYRMGGDYAVRQS